MKLCLDFINFMFLFRKSTKYQLFIAHGPLTDPRNKNSFSQNCSEKFSHEAKYIQVALCHHNLDCGSRKTEDNLIFFWGGEKNSYLSIYFFLYSKLFLLPLRAEKITLWELGFRMLYKGSYHEKRTCNWKTNFWLIE